MDRKLSKILLVVWGLWNFSAIYGSLDIQNSDSSDKHFDHWSSSDDEYDNDSDTSSASLENAEYLPGLLRLESEYLFNRSTALGVDNKAALKTKAMKMKFLDGQRELLNLHALHRQIRQTPCATSTYTQYWTSLAQLIRKGFISPKALECFLRDDIKHERDYICIAGETLQDWRKFRRPEIAQQGEDGQYHWQASRESPLLNSFFDCLSAMCEMPGIDWFTWIFFLTSKTKGEYKGDRIWFVVFSCNKELFLRIRSLSIEQGWRDNIDSKVIKQELESGRLICGWDIAKLSFRPEDMEEEHTNPKVVQENQEIFELILSRDTEALDTEALRAKQKVPNDIDDDESADDES